jgi:hypothetical protein
VFFTFAIDSSRLPAQRGINTRRVLVVANLQIRISRFLAIRKPSANNNFRDSDLPPPNTRNTLFDHNSSKLTLIPVEVTMLTTCVILYALLTGFFLSILRAATLGDRLLRTLLDRRWQQSPFRPTASAPRSRLYLHLVPLRSR